MSDTLPSLQTVAVTGPNGLVGTELRQLLQQEGCRTVGISRTVPPGAADTLKWNPETGLDDSTQLQQVDGVVHLAGYNIAAGRWNEKRKRLIRDSRVVGTRSLVQSLAAIERRPKVLVCASAIGYYGDRGDEILTEDSAPGKGFLAEVCQQWEAETERATELGIRVVKVRIGVVLSRKGGALKSMLLPFRLGLGGVVGSGKQFWSWIGLPDLARVISFCLNNPDISGAVNAVAPNPVTNREFTKTLGRVLHRPTIFPLPAFAAKLVLGEMAEALLLASTRVVPQRLESAGFQFEHPELDSCLRSVLQSDAASATAASA